MRVVPIVDEEEADPLRQIEITHHRMPHEEPLLLLGRQRLTERFQPAYCHAELRRHQLGDGPAARLGGLYGPPPAGYAPDPEHEMPQEMLFGTRAPGQVGAVPSLLELLHHRIEPECQVAQHLGHRPAAGRRPMPGLLLDAVERRENHRLERGELASDLHWVVRVSAMHSISTAAPSASPLAASVERAGGSLGKNDA